MSGLGERSENSEDTTGEFRQFAWWQQQPAQSLLRRRSCSLIGSVYLTLLRLLGRSAINACLFAASESVVLTAGYDQVRQVRGKLAVSSRIAFRLL